MLTEEQSSPEQAIWLLQVLCWGSLSV